MLKWKAEINVTLFKRMFLSADEQCTGLLRSQSAAVSSFCLKKSEKKLDASSLVVFLKVNLFWASVSSSAWWRVSCLCCTVTDRCDSTSCSPVQVCVSVCATCPYFYSISLYHSLFVIHFSFFNLVISFYLFVLHCPQSFLFSQSFTFLIFSFFLFFSLFFCILSCFSPSILFLFLFSPPIFLPLVLLVVLCDSPLCLCDVTSCIMIFY